MEEEPEETEFCCDGCWAKSMESIDERWVSGWGKEKENGKRSEGI